MRDIKSMSVEELRYHLQSGHNQLDVTTGYLHDLDPGDRPTSWRSTWTPRTFRRPLFPRTTNCGSSCARSSSPAVPALQSSALSSENAYLRECVEMADRYLSRLVGDVSIGESDAKQRLRDRFEVVCRRSAKLMSEYQLLQTHAEQLRSETTHENADTRRVLQGVQLLAEHMHVIKPRSSPSRKDLEEAIRRMDGIVLTQMPVVASKLKEYKSLAGGGACDAQTAGDEDTRAAGECVLARVCCQTGHMITFFTTGLDSETDLFGAMW